MVVVLNKMDVLKRERQRIDTKLLAQMLGCPVFTLSANNREQVRRFKEKLHKQLIQGIALKDIELNYGESL